MMIKEGRLGNYKEDPHEKLCRRRIVCAST